jgi:hypothetical protein
VAGHRLLQQHHRPGQNVARRHLPHPSARTHRRLRRQSSPARLRRPHRIILIEARLLYLTFFPYTPPAPGQGRNLRGVRPPLTKQAPYFLDLDIEIAELDQREWFVDGLPIKIRRLLIDELIVSVECAYTLADLLDPAGNARKQTLHAKLLNMIRAESGYTGAFLEEYTIVCLTHTDFSPDDFVQANRLALAALLRNLPGPLTDADADHALISRARYTERDLAIVDWEGALLIDDADDFQSDIELLRIGNYELLRYRLLDRAVERNLETVRRELESKRRLNFFSKVLRDSLGQRLELLLGFEKTEQTLLLIGDWYTAQLYRLIVDEFYIDDWKARVQSKLDQLETVTDIIHQNFTLSWDRALDLAQLIGWLILLVGYFVLFYLDVISVVK